MCSGLESIVHSLTDALGVLKDDVALASQVCRVFMFSTSEPYLYSSNLIFFVVPCDAQPGEVPIPPS